MLALLRSVVEVGTAASWIAIFVAAVITVFVAYVGIAMHAVYRASDPGQRMIRYEVFHDLLQLFGEWWHR